MIGTLLLLGGIVGAVYFFLFFDVSVATPAETFMGHTIGGGRVVNLGLMADRADGVLISCAAALLGLLLKVFTGRR